MSRARIVLADDHTFTLEGLRTVLSPHHDIVAAVTNGQELVDKTLELKPDLVILDITMPVLNGIDAATQIRKNLPSVMLIFVTMHVNPAYLEAAMETGALGYVVKSAAQEELIEAIECARQGRRYVSAGLRQELSRFESSGRTASAPRLSTREREILKLVAEGKASKEIAYLLSISGKTVAFHRENIKRKLGLRSIAELTRYAVEQGLIL